MTQRLTFTQLQMAQRRLVKFGGGNTEETRRSWAIGEIMLSYPEMTRKQAEDLIDDVLKREKSDKGANA